MRVAGAMWAGVAVLAVAGCGIHPNNEFRDEKTIPSGVTAISITGGSGSVRVTGTSDSGIHVKRHVSYRNAKPGGIADASGDTLTLDTDCGTGCTADYEVTAPKTVRVAGRLASGGVDLDGIGSATVTTASGDLKVRGVPGDVTVESMSGEVRLTDVTGAVACRTKSGNIDLTGAGGAVTTESVSGNIRASGLKGTTASAQTTSGNIELTLATPQNVQVESTSGNVRVHTPSGQKYRITTSTRSGNLDMKVANDPAADHTLTVRTTSGNISVDTA
jgi:DUF4097 and DUF4098 domain-containing protein YvlB